MEEYITVLNKFTNGDIYLSVTEVLTYLAAIKFNMKLWDGKCCNGGIDLISEDRTRVAKVVVGKHVSTCALDTFIKLSEGRPILICESQTVIEDNDNLCDILRVNYWDIYDLPNLNYEFTKPETIELSDLKLNDNSSVTYYPYDDTFKEVDQTNVVYNDGIVFIQNDDSMIITIPKNYCLNFMDVLPYVFDKFVVSFKHKHVKLTCSKINRSKWVYLLDSIQRQCHG